MPCFRPYCWPPSVVVVMLSGITANPAVGYAADPLVRPATVVFSEVSEVRDGLHLLSQESSIAG